MGLCVLVILSLVMDYRNRARFFCRGNESGAKKLGMGRGQADVVTRDSMVIHSLAYCWARVDTASEVCDWTTVDLAARALSAGYVSGACL
jgi:hypothetical protein